MLDASLLQRAHCGLARPRAAIEADDSAGAGIGPDFVIAFAVTKKRPTMFGKYTPQDFAISFNH